MANRSLCFSLCFLAIILFHLSHSFVLAHSDFEGFEPESEDFDDDDASLHLSDLPLSSPPLSQSDPVTTPLHSPPPISRNSDSDDSDQASTAPSQPSSSSSFPKSSPTSLDYWDDDEFEGLPTEQPQASPSNPSKVTENPNSDHPNSDSKADTPKPKEVKGPQSFMIEIVCGSFLVIFIINYFSGRRQNENIALSWAAKFAAKDSIFEKNFSLLGVGEGDDSPLLLKEGQNVFKFYASGRRFCQGMLATMELKSRQDLISRIYNFIVPCKDEISLEVYMNDNAMDHVVFALAKKKLAKGMQKEVRDLQRFAALMSPPTGRKWVAEELGVISESKEVASDLITETVLEQSKFPTVEEFGWKECLVKCHRVNCEVVFGEKGFENFGKDFISMHFTDQHPGVHKKVLLFKFSLPGVNNMADISRLVALVPYYIDLIGRYKLSSQARSKTEAARQKIAQEAYKEQQNARQEALQKKRSEKKKLMEEAEAKLSAEALRKKEAKERARQMKKSMPKIKMTRGH